MGEVRSASLFEFGEGGGGFIGEDKDVVLTDLKFIRHVLKKKDGSVVGKGKEQCYLYAKVKVENPDDDAHAESEQYYSVGDIEHFQPSADNKTPAAEGGFIVLTGTYDTIWNKSNYGVFMSEFLSIGLDPNSFAQGVDKLNGIRVHLVGKALPKGKNAAPDAKDFKILVPSAINSLPGEKPGKATAAKPAAAKAGAPAAAAAAPAAAGNGAVDDAVVTEYVKEALSAAGGTLSKKDLGKAVFKLASDKKAGKAIAPITKRASDDEFLGNLAESGIMFDAEAGSVVVI